MPENKQLQKVLKPRHLWALAVGAVCSGNYYGFSYGFEAGGAALFLLAFVPVTVMYVCFMLCYMELAVSIPSAGGASEYAGRAMGGFAGFLAGFSVLTAYIVAPCAVAITTGQLLHYLIPAISPMPATVAFFCLFVGLNLLGAKSSSRLELVATIAALCGLAVFAAAALPHFAPERLLPDTSSSGDMFAAVVKAVPFAMWFFFAVDGPIMQSEELEDPKTGILRGYVPALCTLFVTALIDLLLPAGIADYHEIAVVDYPLTRALELALGEGSALPKVIAAVALFAMAASFSSIVMSFSRQAYAMGRAGYLPKLFSRLNRNGAPVFGLLIPSALALCLCLTGKTAVMVTISVFAALILYALVILSDIRLFRKKPASERPFAIAHPLVPGIALALTAVLFVCVLAGNLPILKWVAAVYAAAVGYYFLIVRKKRDGEKNAG